MTEKVRKRVSKWDIPAEIIQEDILPVKHVDDKEEKMDWTCSKWDGNQLFEDNSVENILYKNTSEANQPSKWFEFQGDDIRISRESSGRPQSPKIPDAEADDTECCKRLHGEPIPEQTPDETVAQSPLPEVEAVGEDDSKWSGLEPNSLNKTTEKDSDAWGIALEQNQRTSPHRDGWGAALDQNQRREGWGAALDQNRRTPDAWKKPRQSNSPQSARSRPLRSRSQGRSRSRSRSRSPYRSKHGSERWGERGRMGSGAVETCRAFAAGRCNKGSQCRYLHEDGSRRDHSRDRSIERHGNRYEGDYRNKSTERCFDFTQGRCQRGSSCRFVHHDPASGDGRSSKDEPRERIHDRGDSLGRRTADLPYRRVSDFPCKYFAEGRCRNGDACKFLHRGELDDNRDYNRGTGSGSNRGEQGKGNGNGNDSRSRLPAVAVVPLPQHAQSFGPSIQIQQAVPPPPQPQMKQFYTVPPNGHQGQYIPPLNPPPSFTHSGPVQPSFNVGAPLNQPNVHQIHMGIPLAQSVAPNQQNLGVYSVKTPELKLDVLPITPKAVTSEQAAQITNLSASLAQFFGNGPQLPQLYAPPPQQQPNPVDNISVPPGFSSVDPKDPEPSLNISAPVSAADDSNAVDKGNTASKNDTGTKKEHSGNADSEGKDSKETRAFKCALVEFVKDVLKPAWKEGHLSKEVHKTIVKKVVEKVTGAMKGSSSIPQTQEKIDVYLDYSKEKLKKLVQAYLEKYV